MALTPGNKLGPYEIVAPLGAGGMGEVYRAKDTRLKRDVAIKVLPEDVANDHERLARFQREAEVLASLNHPHIAHVYGIEGDALVMELVEGEDLSQRIARGPIPIDEALPIARQIAEALEAAHDHGIIHRDLKPANIKVRDDGTVKVLDFGLAKAVDRLEGDGFSRRHGAEDAKASSLQTITTPAMTLRGVVLGTAAYMAPEQAKGKAVDRRADIWAFGCVLYEMLTGERTFAGEDVSDTLVSILRDDPRWAALPANTPPHVRLLLRRCLQRDPQKRLPHIGAARLDLADADTGELTKAVPQSASRWRLAAIGGAVGGALVAGVAVVMMMPAAPGNQDPVVTFTLEPPAGSRFTGGNGIPRFAVSPDGSEIVYQLDDGTSAQLMIRKLSAVDPIALPASKGERTGASMQQAFWSPNGRAIAFFDEETHQLKRFERQFGTLQVVAGVPGNQYGGSWNDADLIVMASSATGGIQSVPATGGRVAQVTTVDVSRFEASHLWPKFFADGRHFVYLTSYSDGTPPALFLGSLDGGPARRLVTSPSGGHPAPPDYLLFLLEGATVAQRVDLGAGLLLGDPTPVGPPAGRTGLGRIALSLSDTGVMVYSTAGDNGDRFDTRWVDRSGAVLPSSPKSLSTRTRGLRLSPNGTLLAYLRGSMQDADGSLEVWVQDIARGIDSKVSSLAAGQNGHSLVFSPDEKELIARSMSKNVSTLLRQPLFAAEPPRPVLTGVAAELLNAYDWTPDGKLLVNRSDGARTGSLWIVPMDTRGRPEAYLPSTVRFGADVSPDGRWLAYTASTDIGKAQIFLQTFPDARGGKWPVSSVGASHPRWSHDGRELYFRGGNQLMAVKVSTSPRLEIGQPKALFSIEEERGLRDPPSALYPYDVMARGEGFVYLASKTTIADARVVVVTDWMRAAGIKH